MACLGKLYGACLDLDNPEEILTIFAFAAGGVAAKAAGKAGMQVGGRVATRVAKSVAKKEAMSALTRVSERVGIQILQRAVVKYAVPIASIGIGMAVNFFTMKTMGRIAKKHMEERAAA